MLGITADTEPSVLQLLLVLFIFFVVPVAHSLALVVCGETVHRGFDDRAARLVAVLIM